jgi:hypothetical protein
MLKKVDAITDFSVEDEHPLTSENAGDYTMETYNQWVYDPKQDIGLNLWVATSNRSFPKFMSHVLVFDRGDVWVGRFDGNGNPPGGVSGGNVFITLVEPFRRLDIQVLGLLRKTGGGKQELLEESNQGTHLCRMDLTVDIRTPPVEQGSQGDRGGEASYGSTPRKAVRYEQLCCITGPVRIGDREVQVEAYGMRSHRRNSSSIYANGAVGHTWATALFPSGRGFHLLSYQVAPDARVDFLYGHYFDGERYHDAEVTRFPFFSGENKPESYQLEMKVGGQTIAATCDSIPAVPGLIPSTDVQLTRSPARFTLDGEIGGGVLERSLSVKFPFGGLYAR